LRLELLEELLRRGQRATVRARGGSMWPALRDGDVLTLQGIPEDPDLQGLKEFPRSQEITKDLDLQVLQHRDVVAVRCGDALVIHRAVRQESGQLLLRGDACPAPDGCFPLAAVLGRVVSVRRAGRAVRLSRGRLAPLSRLLLRAARALSVRPVLRPW
jgi:hypothetical protein